MSGGWELAPTLFLDNFNGLIPRPPRLVVNWSQIGGRERDGHS